MITKGKVLELYLIIVNPIEFKHQIINYGLTLRMNFEVEYFVMATGSALLWQEFVMGRWSCLKPHHAYHHKSNHHPLHKTPAT